MYPLAEVLLLLTCATIASCEDSTTLSPRASIIWTFCGGSRHFGIPCVRSLQALVNRIADLFRQRFRRETRNGTSVLHFVASGEGALDRLTGEINPQLIVIPSDIKISGMDGLELSRQRQYPHRDEPRRFERQ